MISFLFYYEYVGFIRNIFKFFMFIFINHNDGSIFNQYIYNNAHEKDEAPKLMFMKHEYLSLFR